MHHANPVTPIEDTMRAMKELQEFVPSKITLPTQHPLTGLPRCSAGKIKHIGLSAISSATLRRAVKIAPVAAVQVDYSPFVLDIEGPAGTDLLATCRELGVALVAAMPLNRGLLTASYASKGAEGVSEGDAKDMRVKVMPRFLAENVDTNIKLVNEFQALGEKYGCTIPQLALAWLLKQGDDVIPIPGTKKLHYLQENWKALDVELSTEAEKEVRLFVESASAKLAGGPLPTMFEGYNFRDTAEEVVV
jgi:aryl-alcohol dehydrogenase-like predicted oxidoreductase